MFPLFRRSFFSIYNFHLNSHFRISVFMYVILRIVSILIYNQYKYYINSKFRHDLFLSRILIHINSLE